MWRNTTYTLVNATTNYERVLIPRFISAKNGVEESEPYTSIIRHLAEDRARNEIIVRDAVEAVNTGQTPIILTALISHAECLCEMLSPYCQNIIRLIGTNSAKQKRLVMETMRAIPSDEKMIIVATGRYVGEGFDFPRLDTLLLALPVSWKGIVAQYAGRLHREYEGKTSSQIYDYIDLGTPICEKMYHKRLKAYKSIGYTAVQNDDVDNCGYIYDGGDYFDSYLRDLSNASREVTISVPRASKIANPKVAIALQSLVAIGIRVRIITSEDEFDRGPST